MPFVFVLLWVLLRTAMMLVVQQVAVSFDSQFRVVLLVERMEDLLRHNSHRTTELRLLPVLACHFL